MGQKVHPVGFRLGIFEDWHAHWFIKKGYGIEVLEDLRIRKYLKNKLNDIEIGKIVIDKAVDNVKISILSSRPGVIIGKKGVGIEKIKQDLHDLLNKNIELSVQEVRSRDLSAVLVAKSIAEQLEKRVNYKRLLKKAGFAAMKNGAKGIKICVAGRLGGAEIARTEWLRLGSVPLHTLRSNVDFYIAEAITTYGVIGVKVWICKGEY
ncbi:MAG: 30S ribosomal protein S3 [candidate division TM6 bacterium GW2011_GWF2_37_49]|nr:MAG: 30S ribosomal protein S3 [candidate division TM6 bacterium GW2011_GWF2_37_49]